jgi:hypothetical protein
MRSFYLLDLVNRQRKKKKKKRKKTRMTMMMNSMTTNPFVPLPEEVARP